MAGESGSMLRKKGLALKKHKKHKTSIKLVSFLAALLIFSWFCKISLAAGLYDKVLEKHNNQISHSFDLSIAWKALWAGEIEKAKGIFISALGKDSDNIEAINGLGFVAFREGNLNEAANYFAGVLARSASDRDALVGMALIEERLEKFEKAQHLLDKVLKAYPDDAEAKLIYTRIINTPPSKELHIAPLHRPDILDIPMRVNKHIFELRAPDGTYRPIFLKAVNLGAALPGKFPSEFPTDPNLYHHWFTLMRECGFTAIRVYTIFPPVFYDTLARFNSNRPDPLYLIHGVWTELPDDNNFSKNTFIESFRAEIRRVIDLLHGSLDLPPCPGHAFGRYRSDVSRWWIATILGREWEPHSVIAYNAMKPDKLNYFGRFLTAQNVSAFEYWLAEQIDYAIAYETDRWNAQRPIAWTNWPTLDPLYHPTETTIAEENVHRRRLGLPELVRSEQDNDEDAVGVDLEKFEVTSKNQGGLFGAYHVYPYYPDFMIYDPKYQTIRDKEGPNAYLGYLKDLVSYHKKHPVFIAEFGVPTSREIAHIQPQGWTHGGHNEQAQGEINARLFHSIYESGAAGGSLFSWIDEWFKHNWLVIEFHRPLERKPLWHDRQDAEENYGLIGYRAGTLAPHVVIDGKENDWSDKDNLLKSSNDIKGLIRSLSVQSDETDIFLLLKIKPDTNAAFAIVIDIIDPALGDFRFPAGLDLKSPVGFEAAILFDGQRARVVIDYTYDRWTNRFQRPYRPRLNDKGIYVSPKTQPNRLRISREGKIFPATILDIGWLRRGTTDRNDLRFDDLAEWQFNPSTGVAEFRIPWGILNVTDPSSRSVLFEGEDYPEGYQKTEGFHFAVVAFTPAGGDDILSKDGKVLDILPAQNFNNTFSEFPLYSWNTWEKPNYYSFLKRSYSIIKNTIKNLPDSPKIHQNKAK